MTLASISGSEQGTAPASLAGLVGAVFQAWHDAKVDFLVLRNYEELPAATGNDIDILVSPGQVALAEAVLLLAAERTGFRLHNRGEFATLALYFSGPGTSGQAHFDLFTALKWRGFDFLDCGEFLRNKVARGPFFVPHPAHEAATNLLAFLLYAGKVKDKYKASISAGFAAHREAALELLARSYGREAAFALVDAGARGNWTEIERGVASLRRSLVARQLGGRPLKSCAFLLKDALRLTRRFLHPPGIAVVLCGPDGCGKSTAGTAVIERLRTTFSPEKGSRYHWKPPLFSASRRATRGPVTAPHSQPPRSTAVSLFYFGFHWMEFVLGYWLRVQPLRFRGGMVLIDRYYYDFFVDQRRYRLRVPSALVRMGYRLLPKPDVLVVMDAPAETLQSRKQEVSLEESERQRRAYLQLADCVSEAVIVDAGQPAEQVAGDIVKAILARTTARTRIRIRGVRGTSPEAGASI